MRTPLHLFQFFLDLCQPGLHLSALPTGEQALDVGQFRLQPGTLGFQNITFFLLTALFLFLMALLSLHPLLLQIVK